ncbi:MAG: helix-turn-helix domain-containing protein [Vicinamibacterales bacterium]
MRSPETPLTTTSDVEQRIARRLARLRAERGWTLDELAELSGVSRATLSRLERSELSPTAAMLGRLCAVHGWTLARLVADAESTPPRVVRALDQSQWTDPESGSRRRAVSPPAPGLRGELVEVRIPAGATMSYEEPPLAGLEHHLWLLEGALTLEIAGAAFPLQAGDCICYGLTGPTRVRSTGVHEARYVTAVVRP